jgi:hypothetical protein
MTVADIAQSDIDVFSDEVLANPYAAILFVTIQLVCFNKTRRLLTAGPSVVAASHAAP